MRLDKEKSFYLLLMLDSLAFNGVKKLGLPSEKVAEALQDFRRLLLVVIYNFELEEYLQRFVGARDEDIENVKKMFEQAKRELGVGDEG